MLAYKHLEELVKLRGEIIMTIKTSIVVFGVKPPRVSAGRYEPNTFCYLFLLT